MLSLVALPAAAGLAHRDPREPGARAGEYSLRISRVDIAFKTRTSSADDSPQAPPAGFVFGHVQVWVETHDGAQPRMTDFVIGPTKFRPDAADPAGYAKDRLKVNQVVYEHEDCAPAEEMRISAEFVLLDAASDVPRKLRRPKGGVVPGRRRAQLEEVLDGGHRMLDFDASPHLRPAGAGGASTAVVGAGSRARWQADVQGRGTYRVGDGPCEPSATTTPPAETTPPASTAPAAPTGLAVTGGGYEHPDPPAQNPPYSAVCADVVATPAGAGAGTTGSARLEMFSGGEWVAEAGPTAFTLRADGRATVKFGINVADRRYRIVATLGDLTATSDPIAVPAGSPPSQTRDCHPPG